MTSNADELAPSLAPGTLLAGKYRVERVLGTGGMGVVVAARHLHLDEMVAIKILHSHLVDNGELVTRFLREGRAMIKIRSEHAVKVHDVGLLESGAPYLVMEYLDGEDLAKLLRRQGPLAIEIAVDLILQACEAIAEAHSLGIVHRDLKPANLFLTHRADGSSCVKVLDFGISKAQIPGSNDFEITKTQVVMGSPRYMSPEQMRSARTVDHRTDIWAVGTIMYELLSGTTPFHAETMTELCAQILQDAPVPLTEARPSCPPDLDAAISRALAKKLPDRFQNLAELAMAMTPFATSDGRISAQRIARVLKVSTPEAPHSGVVAAAAHVPALPDAATQAFAGATTASAEIPAVRTGMVWGSQTGPHPSGKSKAVILIAALAAGLFLISGIALVAVLLIRRTHAPPAPAVEPIVLVDTPAPIASTAPAPLPQAIEAARPLPTSAGPTSAAPVETEAPPTPAAKTASPNQKSSKSSGKGSKDLPFSGRF